MRRIFRRYTQLTVPQKRLYSLLTAVTTVTLLLYCLGIGGFLLRSNLVPEVALETPPTFTASPSAVPTAVAPPGSTATPTATLPPTPTQLPIPTFTPTPESVNITVVITTTGGVTTTTIISATVTPTPVLTPTVTVTAEVALAPRILEPATQSVDGPPLLPATEIDQRAQVSPGAVCEILGQTASLRPWNKSARPLLALPSAGPPELLFRNTSIAPPSHG
jgi:hypothetical protein